MWGGLLQRDTGTLDCPHGVHLWDLAWDSKRLPPPGTLKVISGLPGSPDMPEWSSGAAHSECHSVDRHPGLPCAGEGDRGRTAQQGWRCPGVMFQESLPLAGPHGLWDTDPAPPLGVPTAPAVSPGD